MGAVHPQSKLTSGLYVSYLKLTNSKEKGIGYLCQNKEAYAVLYVPKSQAPADHKPLTLREITKLGEQWKKELIQHPEEALAVSTELKRMSDKKLAKLEKSNILSLLVQRICDCLRNFIRGAGWNTTATLARQLSDELAKYSPKPQPQPQVQPQPQPLPPAPAAVAPRIVPPAALPQELAAPVPAAVHVQVVQPAVLLQALQQPVMPSVPVKLATPAQPVPSPVTPASPAKLATPVPVLPVQRAVAPEASPKPAVQPAVKPPAKQPTKTPVPKAAAAPSTPAPVVAPASPAHTAPRQTLSKDAALQAYKQDPEKCSQQAKMTIWLEIGKFEPTLKEMVSKKIVSVQQLLEELGQSKTIDLTNNLCAHAVADTFIQASNTTATTALAEWLPKQRTFTPQLLGQCLHSLVERQKLKMSTDPQALDVLFRHYTVNSWNTKKDPQQKVLLPCNSSVIVSAMEALLYEDHNKYAATIQWMVDQNEFDLNAFKQLIGVFIYKASKNPLHANTRMDARDHLLAWFTKTPQNKDDLNAQVDSGNYIPYLQAMQSY